MRRNVLKILLLLMVLIIVVVLINSSVYDQQSLVRFRQWIQSKGALGGMMFVLAFTFLQPLGFGSHVFIVGASMIWTPLQAALFSLAGVTSSSCLAFYYARFIGREWVQSRLPRKLNDYQKG